MTRGANGQVQDHGDQEYPFTERDFAMIAEIAHRRYGLYLQASKKPLVYSRLTKRLRALALPNFETYCQLLSEPQGQQEHAHLLSALTTNVTHFFREMHHFTALREKILPSLIEKARSGSPVRIWSSACSAGQEAFSIAAVIRKEARDFASLDIKILATDVDPQMIQKAREATYDHEQTDAIPAEYKTTMIEQNGDSFKIKSDITKMVMFGELNLVDPWPMRRKFDIIFCRNAAIYFDKETQSRLWQRFSDSINISGHLMIGHSERLTGPAQAHFRNVGITTYQRLTHIAGGEITEKRMGI